MKTQPVDAKKQFLSMLTESQLREYHNPYINSGRICRRVPVESSMEGEFPWHIELVSYGDGNMVEGVARICQPSGLAGMCGRQLCYHALDNVGCSLNRRDPFLAAIAFLLQLQAFDGHVRSNAG